MSFQLDLFLSGTNILLLFPCVFQKADPTQFLQVHGRKGKIHLDASVAAAAENPAIMQVIFEIHRAGPAGWREPDFVFIVELARFPSWNGFHAFVPRISGPV